VFAADTLRATSGQNDLAEALASLRQHTEGFLAVTDGANDILWLDGAAVRRIPVVAVEVVDTLAAGDVFHGAFALALAERMGETEALRFAAASAALKCTRHGGGAGAPNRVEVEHVLRACNAP
jgi:sugar/nucleoside kinase (ribokinase family)